jgi:hypothetical protein
MPTYHPEAVRPTSDEMLPITDRLTASWAECGEIGMNVIARSFLYRMTTLSLPPIRAINAVSHV